MTGHFRRNSNSSRSEGRGQTSVISLDLKHTGYWVLDTLECMYSQLGVIRKQENGRPPRFLGSFLYSGVNSPGFPKRPAERQGRIPSFLETGANAPQFLLKITKFYPKILNGSASSNPQLAVVGPVIGVIFGDGEHIAGAIAEEE